MKQYFIDTSAETTANQIIKAIGKITELCLDDMPDNSSIHFVEIDLEDPFETKQYIKNCCNESDDKCILYIGDKAVQIVGIRYRDFFNKIVGI